MSFLQMSIYGGIMILAVAALRAAVMNRLPKKMFLALWGIVLLRLLVPFSLPSPFSAYSFASNHLPASLGKGGMGVASLVPVPTTVSSAGDGIILGPTASLPLPVVVWGIGFLACALFFTAAYWKCHREFRESLPVQNDFLAEWIARHRLTRTIAIRQSGRIAAPLTYGVFKPVILLPKNTRWEEEKQIAYILAHEFVHIRRFDTATKLLLTAALCLHWFNPLVWVMYILSNRDMELSCDEAVVRSFGDTTKAAYARTLIGMEEKKSTLTPLCNHFSKNAIEERITAIMKIKKTSVMAVVLAVVIIIGVTTAFATSATSDPDESPYGYGKTVGEYEREKLLDFQFDGYESMTVAAYQEKAWALRDTADYHQVLERISQNNMFYKMRFNNNTYADFMFNVLEPLTAERWQTREFGYYAQAPLESVKGDESTLEYNITLTILDAKRVTVGQYNGARQGTMDDLQQFLLGKSNAELQDEGGMEAAILAEIAALKSKWETPALQMDIEYKFKPLFIDEDASDVTFENDKEEQREYPHATTADYQSLLKLKTADYESMSVADFNATLLEWANEDYERNERINIDRAWNDFEAPLTHEERTFVTLTAWASGADNTELVRAEHTGRKREDPILGNFELTKEVDDASRTAYANLFYQLTCHTADESKLTVGERDRALAGTINEIQQLWDDTDMDTLLQVDAGEILTKVKRIAEKHSTPLYKISFSRENGLHMKASSEPKMRE